jgi:hypothetical protein
MVIMLGIGQSAALLSKSVMEGYDRRSTTERVLVDNDGLPILNRLKIQSSPYRKDGYQRLMVMRLMLVSNREREKRVTP